jgi:predicted O-linked N-acetylglucosamine transferase (SPINDLY family)
MPSAGLPGPPFRLFYQGLDDRPLQEALARALRLRCPELTYVAPHIGRPRRPGPFRVAFASSTLRFHTVGRLMGGLIPYLRAPDVEVSVFQDGRQDDAANRIAESADRAFRLAGTLADRQRIIAETEPDLLIYPEIGMEQAIWHLAFARLAPVQAVTWGHPVTTGIDTIDVYLSAVDHEPEDADRHYSERLVRLAAMPMILGTMPAPIPFDRARYGLPAGVPLLACLQSPFKIHPDSDALFAEVLRAAPEALLVIPHWVETVWVDRIHRRFARTHPELADRLVHVPRLEHREYLGFVQACDGLLDPPHFTGGQSTLEAFLLGTPIVTLPGALMRGRLTYGFYRRLGIEEAVASDAADFARIAARLVRDRAWRDDLGRRIRVAAGKRLLHDLTGAEALASYVRDLAGLGRRQKSSSAASIAATE